LTAARSRYVVPSFFLLLGAIFIVYSLFSGREVLGIVTTIGVGFCLSGTVVLAVDSRAYGRKPGA
jgi:hypothetical protein